jgi:hypothetical protein
MIYLMALSVTIRAPNGKDLEGSSSSLLRALFRKLFKGTEENHEKI